MKLTKDFYRSEKGQHLSIFLCWLVYTCTYFGKFSYNANISLIESDYSVTHAQAGLVLTFFSIAYGIGQVVNGILCKKYSRRYIVVVSLGVAAAINLAVFFGVPFSVFKYLWVVLAFFLSMLWPEMMLIISENIGGKLMPRAVMIMSTTTPTGTLLIYGLSALLAHFGMYKVSFLISSFLLIITAIIWVVFFKQGDFLTEAKEKSKSNPENSNKASGWLSFMPFVIFGVLVVLSSFGKDGFQSWAPVILKQLHGMPDSLSILLTLLLPILGIIGAVITVSICKKQKYLLPVVIFLFFAISACNLVILLFYKNLFVLVTSFGLIEALFHGIANIIVSMFPLSMREKYNSGFLSGVLNGCSYAGSALSSFLLGSIADKSGWDSVFLVLLISAIVSLVVSGIYVLIASKKKEMLV